MIGGRQGGKSYNNACGKGGGGLHLLEIMLDVAEPPLGRPVLARDVVHDPVPGLHREVWWRGLVFQELQGRRQTIWGI